jgi:hypothetical protein
MSGPTRDNKVTMRNADWYLLISDLFSDSLLIWPSSGFQPERKDEWFEIMSMREFEINVLRNRTDESHVLVTICN